jgi:hypothetical protein
VPHAASRCLATALHLERPHTRPPAARRGRRRTRAWQGGALGGLCELRGLDGSRAASQAPSPDSLSLSKKHRTGQGRASGRALRSRWPVIRHAGFAAPASYVIQPDRGTPRSASHTRAHSRYLWIAGLAREKPPAEAPTEPATWHPP